MNSIESIDFNNIGTLVATYLLLSVFIFLRHIIFSGIYYFVFLVLFRKKMEKRILTLKQPGFKQMKREIILSVYSALIFAFFGLIMLLLWQSGMTMIYLDVFEFPLWYIPLSVLLFLFIQDTYYYWLHKWMHHSKWLNRIHLEHHRSVNTTVWTSFSFHPLESVFQAVIVPLIFMILPMHIGAVLFVLLIMTFSSIINHAGVEIYGNKPVAKSMKKYVIGATHHDSHHRNAKKNLGLYFTFWDRLMNTEFRGA